MVKQNLKIAPSSMPRVVNCPHSVKYNKAKYYDADIDYDEKPVMGTDAISRGIVAHRYAAAVLRGDKEKQIEISTWPAFTEKLADNIMMNYVAKIYSFMPTRAEHPILKIEYDLKDGRLDWLYLGCYGRADAIIDADHDLWVIDMKYGNDKTEAKNNYQLLAYAIGAEDEATTTKPEIKHERIHIVIINAFNGEKSVWDLTREEAAAEADKMKKRIDEALGERPSWRAGPHCDHCPHRDKCGTWITWIITGSRDMSHPEVDDKARAKEILLTQATEWLETRGKSGNRDAIAQYVVENIKNGEIKSKELKETTYYKWTDTESKYILEKLYDAGFDPGEVTEIKPLSPAKLLKKYGDNEEIQKIIKERAKKITRTTIKDR